jgi:glycosyltransferase involved in cell wall biosynthesis
MKFSIGIPAFKASFLKECIDSVLAQTYTDFELIIVNDASPENIDEIVNGYSNSKISYYVNEKNNGAENVVDNWNRCLSYANGEFFVLMGDDDLMAPEYLQEFAELILKHPELDVFHCRSYIINELSKKIDLTPSWPEYETVLDNIWHRITDKRVQYISDFVYRKSRLIANGGFYKLPLAWGSDDISAYIGAYTKGIAHVNYPLFFYRKSPQTISKSGNVKLKFEAIELEIKWIRNMVRDYPRSNDDNGLLCRKILERLPLYHKKKRIYTLSYYFHYGFFQGVIKVLSETKCYIGERFFAIALFLYKKIG